MISVYTFFTWDIPLRDGKHEGLCGIMSGIKDRWLYLAQDKFANLVHFPFFPSGISNIYHQGHL